MPRLILSLSLAGGLATGFAAHAEGTFVELYGSSILPDAVQFCDPGCSDYDTDRRTGYGVGVYSSRLLAGFDVGLDVMVTDGTYSPPYENDVIASTSVMAVIRRNFALTPKLEVFVGLGLGAIAVENSSSGVFDTQSGAGGQIEGGVRFSLSDSMGIFASYKQQRLFSNVVYDGPLLADDAQADYHAEGLNLGVLFRF
ncbi:Outer membrane protein beta-barrel domain containing protein [Paracoccaceae bacterium]|jgi:opacity protein-like surface antigen